MSDWKLLSQKETGDYWFNGKFYATEGIKKNLSPSEIRSIIKKIEQEVEAFNGLHFVQTFKSIDGRIVYFIDQLTKRMIRSKQFNPSMNQATLMTKKEYELGLFHNPAFFLNDNVN